MDIKITELITICQERVSRTVQKYQKKEEVWKYTEISLTLFVIAFFTLFAIRPAAVTISGLVGEIKEKEKISLEMKKKINSVITAQEEYALYQQKVDLIDSFLPVRFNLASGLAQIVGAAGEAKVAQKGIGLAEINLGQPQKTTEVIGGTKRAKKGVNKNIKTSQHSPLKEIDFNFHGDGRFPDFKNFVNFLLGTRRWIEITRYQLAQKTKEEKDKIRITLDGKIYFWSAVKK